MLPKRCARLMWATHTKSPELLHSSPSPGWKGRQRGRRREAQRSSSFGFPSLGSSFSLLQGWVSQDSAKGAAPSPQNQTPKMAQLNTLSVALFFVWKRVRLWEAGAKVCLPSESCKGRCFRKKEGEKKGHVSIWVHLCNIPSGAVVWLTSVG